MKHVLLVLLCFVSSATAQAQPTDCLKYFTNLKLRSNAVDGAQTADLSRQYLREEIERSHRGTAATWYRNTLERDLDQALGERSNFQHYLDHGLEPGEQVFWMQQRKLKELNEKLWDIGGTEYYLMTLDRQLGALLKERPELGRVIHRNYKDRVVVSNLSPEEFRKQVMVPLKARVSDEIAVMKDRLSTGYLWSDYMDDSIELAQGPTLQDAFLSLHLAEKWRSLDQWKAFATAKRDALNAVLQAARPGEPLEKYLRGARQRKDDPKKLAQWLESEGIAPAVGPELLSYMDSLRIADFLPLAKPLSEADTRILALSQAALKADPSSSLSTLPRIESIIEESWVFQRSRFLKEAQGAHYMVATDIRGLGEKGMMAQDHWLRDGADPNALSSIYDNTTAALNGRYAEVQQKLQQVVGPAHKVGVYRSGDDALWSLPELTIDQKNSIDQIFKSQGDMYYATVDINTKAGPSGVADAIHGSREKLFSDKAAIKGRDVP